MSEVPAKDRKFQDLYVLATEGAKWTIDQDFKACFDWTDDDGPHAVIALYKKRK